MGVQATPSAHAQALPSGLLRLERRVIAPRPSPCTFRHDTARMDSTGAVRIETRTGLREGARHENGRAAQRMARRAQPRPSTVRRARMAARSEYDEREGRVSIEPYARSMPPGDWAMHLRLAILSLIEGTNCSTFLGKFISNFELNASSCEAPGMRTGALRSAWRGERSRARQSAPRHHA
jgi:hypothetical protein